MKRIGILGGMSWESSVEYERLINIGIRNRIGGASSGDLIVRSYDFSRIEALQDAGEWDVLAELLAADALCLERNGAELLVIATNTMHVVAPQIEAKIGIPLIHIGDVAAAAVRDAGVTKVALLGTRHTMEMDFYRSRLADAGIDTLIPREPDRTEIHRIIYDELVRGIIDDGSRADVLAIIQRMLGDGAQGVIAGCTEIELLVTSDDVDVPYFPTTSLHAEAAVEAALR